MAVWRAHDASILGTAEWGFDKLITHGRDNTLRIWQLRAADESTYSTLLPADGPSAHRPKPWLLHALPVNTLNFCAFSMCYESPAVNRQQGDGIEPDRGRAPPTRVSESILVAVPSRDDKKIEVYRFPDEKLVSIVPRVQTIDTGMVMAVKLLHHQLSNSIIVIAGYEGGFTAVHLLHLSSQKTGKSIPEFAKLIYLSQPHTQPVLSLDASPDAKMFFTSSADAVIAAHRIPEPPLDIDHSVLASPNNRIDNKIVTPPEAQTSTQSPQKSSTPLTNQATPLPPAATGSGDLCSSEAPTHSSQPALSFSKKPISPLLPSSTTPGAGLSSLLSSASSQPKTKPSPPSVFSTAVQPPYKTAQTKHAGQQSLCVRSDGRLLVTGGWDSRVRIYSTKSLKELAVLKWHKEGVYTVDFGAILDVSSLQEVTNDISRDAKDDITSQGGEVLPQGHGAASGLSRLQRQREEQIQTKHWVAAGSKDGKVSLWEVF